MANSQIMKKMLWRSLSVSESFTSEDKKNKQQSKSSLKLIKLLRQRWSNLEDYFFFYHGFLSRILVTNMTAGEGRVPSYSILPLPPAHEHSFICKLICEMTLTYF